MLITIGRDASCNFVIDSPRVSGSHCQIRFFADRFEVTDLGSSNGTFVGAERTRVQAPTTVFPGQPLFLGTMEISPSEVAGRMGLQWPAAAPASGGRAFVVGRDPECDFVIDSPKISGRHCQLRFAGDRVELTDLGSSNGTFVGEERARVQGPVTLFPGQVAFMGSMPLPIEEVARRFGLAWGPVSRGAAPTVAESMPVSPEANRLAAERAALEQERLQFEQAKLAAAAPPRAAAAPASKPKNQVVQIAVFLLLLVGGGVFFFLQQQDGSGGGSSDSAQTPPETAAATPPAAAAGADTPPEPAAAATPTPSAEPSTEAPVVVERGDLCVITWRGRDLVTDDRCAEGSVSNLRAVDEVGGKRLPIRADNQLFYMFGMPTYGTGNLCEGSDFYLVGVTADDAWVTRRMGECGEATSLSSKGDAVTLKLTTPEGAVTCKVKARSAQCSKPVAPPKPKVLSSRRITVSGKLHEGFRANGDKPFVEPNSGESVEIDDTGGCAISSHYDDWADVDLLCEDLADGTTRCACEGLRFAD